jgi:NADPH-dependent ferric siderophore reductase
MNFQPKFPAYGTPPPMERWRHEIRRRRLTVSSIQHVTPNMLRLTLTGDDLADFTSLSPGDHVKVFVPGASGQMEMRDYTPRRFHSATKTLVLDFALHEAGPATLWALNARVGDALEIGGPRGSLVIADVKRWLLIGDETALPSIGRRIEEAQADTEMTSLVAVSGPLEHQQFETRSMHQAHWIHRPLSAANDPASILEQLQALDIAPDTFIWIGIEATVARAIRSYLTEARGIPLPWIRASGYWTMGVADAHDKLD